MGHGSHINCIFSPFFHLFKTLRGSFNGRIEIQSVLLSFVHPLDGGKSEPSMVGDDPDGKKEHDEGGDGVDNEHKGEAGELEHHGVEAGVDPAAEHGNGQADAASKGPGVGY